MFLFLLSKNWLYFLISLYFFFPFSLKKHPTLEKGHYNHTFTSEKHVKSAGVSSWWSTKELTWNPHFDFHSSLYELNWISVWFPYFPFVHLYWKISDLIFIHAHFTIMSEPHTGSGKMSVSSCIHLCRTHSLHFIALMQLSRKWCVWVTQPQTHSELSF